MKNKLRRISAMILSLLMTISMVGGDVLTVVALDETYQETESVTETEPATSAETESQTESETPAPTEAVTEATTEAAPETEETVQTTEETTESAAETQAETAPSTEQETEAPSYTVNFKIHENGTAKVYVNGQEVTYKVTDEGKVTFIVEANDQFEVNVEDTISANPGLNIHRTSRTDVNEFKVSEVKSDITINIHTQKIPETESEEPPSEETQASETETTETSEETETEETESETIEETVVETESETETVEETTEDETTGDELLPPLFSNGISLFSISGNQTVNVGDEITLKSNQGTGTNYSHQWSVDPSSRATISANGSEATLTGLEAGEVTVTHQWRRFSWQDWNSETYQVTVVDEEPETPEADIRRIYVYVKLDAADGVDTSGWTVNGQGWYTIGYVDAVVPSPDNYDNGDYLDGEYKANVLNALSGINYYSVNQAVSQGIDLSNIDWNAAGYGLKVADGATDYGDEAPSGTKAWHLDGLLTLEKVETHTVTVHYVYENGSEAAPTVVREGETGTTVSIDSPVLPGYTASQSVVEATILRDNVTITVVYRENFPTDTITITAGSGSRVYDGTPLTAGYTYTDGILKEGDVLTATVSGSQTNAGSSENVVTDYRVMRGDTDVTAKYHIDTVEGTLEITKRPVSLRSETDSKPYDGTALTRPDVEIGGLGFVEGEATARATGTITNVGGPVPNTIQIEAGTGYDENNYAITKSEGTLTITPNTTDAVLNVTGYSGTYDAQNHSVTGEDVTGDVEGTQWSYQYRTDESAEWEDAKPEFKDAGNYTVYVKASNANYGDLTASADVIISKATITVTTGGAERAYNGDALTSGVITVEGYVDKEVTTYKTTGSQTEVGESMNTYELTYGEGYKASNYNAVTENLGTLKVTPNTTDAVLNVTGYSGTYDAQNHSVTGEDVTGDVEGTQWSYQYRTDESAEWEDAKPEFKDAGSYTVYVKASNANYGDLTASADVIISKATITVTTGGAERAYNGDALTSGVITVEGYVDKEVTAYKTTGSQTEVGESMNTYELTYGEGYKASNYNAVTENLGTLKVTPNTTDAVLNVTGYSGTYDAQNHSVTGEDVTGDVEGTQWSYQYRTDESAEWEDAKPEFKDAGSYTVYVKASNANYGDLTASADVIISKATITVTTGGAERAYNGDALTSGVITVEGYVDKEVTAYKTTGSQTEVGESMNTYELTYGEGYKASNYNAVTENLGTLKVTPNTTDAVLNVTGYSGTYDAQNHSVTGEDVTGDVEGTQWSYQYRTDESAEWEDAKPEFKDAGNYTVYVKASNANYGDLTASADVIISKATITVTTGGAERAYNGDALTSGVITVEGYVDKEVTAYKTTGSQTEVGESMNTYELTYGEGYKASNYNAVTENLGTLKVTPNTTDAVLNVTGYSGTYDAQNHSVTGEDVTGDVEGTQWSYQYRTDESAEWEDAKPEFKDAGSYTVYVKASNANYGDLTASADVIISKATITVTTGGAERAYKTTGSQTEVGESMNTYELTYGEGYKASNYNAVTENLGTLKVTPNTTDAVLNVTGYSGTYDAQNHSVTGEDVTGDVEGTQWSYQYRTDESAEWEDAKPEFKDAGSYTVYVKASNANYGDLTASADVIISKATITVTTGGAERAYNGDALTSGVITVEGYVDKEVTAYKTTGSQTEVGESMNTYELTYGEGYKASNYNAVTENLGTLKVTPNTTDAVLNVTGYSGTYDAQNHSVTGEDVTGDVEGTQWSYQYRTDESAEWEDAKPEFKDAGNYTVYVKASNANYGDLTASADVIISKATITVTTGGAERAYNGDALTSGVITVEGYVDKEVTAYKTTGSQTEVGESMNTYELTYGEGYKASNYNAVTENLGTLKVTPNTTDAVLNVTGYSGTYDAQNHSVTGEDVTGDVEGTQWSYQYRTDESAEWEDAKPEFKDAGNYTVYVKASNANYGDLTASADVIISKATITVTTGGAERAYNGDALTSGVITVEGYVDKEVTAYKTTGSQTEVGESMNTYELTYGEGYKASNYNAVTENLGTLKVTPNTTDAVLNVTGYSGTYDAQNHSVTGEDVTGDVEGTQWSYQYRTDESAEWEDAKPEFKDAGNYTVYVKASNANYGDLTASADVIISKATITVTTGGAERAYNGDALTSGVITVEGYVDKEVTAYKTTGSQTEVGESMNTYELTYGEGYKASNYNAVTENLGTLKVTPNTTDAVLNVTGYSGTYDAQNHSVTGEDVTGDVEGTQWSYQYRTDESAEWEDAKPEFKDAGSYTVYVKASNANYGDLTASADVIISKATITVTTGGAERAYNGDALTSGVITVEGYADDEVTAYKTTGSQTEVGESMNTYELTYGEGYKASNYNAVTENLGTLKVTPNTTDAVLNVTGYSGTYDAQNHSVTGEDVTGDVEGTQWSYQYRTDESAEWEDAKPEFKDAGNYTVYVKASNANYGDLTASTDVIISKRPITVTANSASKTYDATPLVMNASEITSGELVSGHSYEATIEGSQTFVGNSSNTIVDVKVYDADEQEVTSNYEIVKAPGTLTVTDGTPDKPVDPNKVVTKTHEDKTYGLGDTIVFNIEVTNIYNEAKTITISEQEGVTITGQSVFENVAPGEKVTTTAEYVVTEADLLAGTFTNKVTASFDGGKDFENTDTVDKFEDPNGHMTVTKMTESEPANGAAYALGETITYKITVKNDGNLTLNNVIVTDILTGDSWTIGTFEPGDVRTYDAEHTVTEMDILNGKVRNVAVASGTSPDGKNPGTSGEEEDPTVAQNPSLFVEKTANDTNMDGKAYGLGDTVSYTIKVTNNGNMTIKDITINDDLTGATKTVDSLEPSEFAELTTTHTITEEDLVEGKVVNVATATGKDPNGKDVEGEGSKTITTEETKPHLTITKDTTSTPANGETYALGETITYKIIAANDGNLTLTNVVVTDELTEDAWTIESLAPGESREFTAEYTVTEADVLAGKVVNVATATGTSPDPEKPDPEVDEGEKEDPTEEKNGHLTITKDTTSTPANGETYALGETITYKIIAANDGNLTLTNVVVTDELTEDAWTIESLAPGESREFTAEYTVTEADVLAGKVVNVATATGTSPDPEKPDPEVDEGEKEDPTEEKNGHLTITKDTTSTPANGETYALGETITYKIIAANDGNLTLTNVVVTDELTEDAWTIESLAPGESREFTAEYTVTEADVLAGKVVNVATATGTSPDPEKPDPEVDEGEKEDPTEEKNGHLTITKDTTSTPENGEAYALGETIIYKIIAANDGNLTLTNVVVTDELTEDAWTIESLAPGESREFTAEYTVTEADVLAGKVVNVATATGTSPDPEKPDPEVDEGEKEDPTEEKNGHLTITKDTTSTPENGEAYALGETITYKIIAANDGNLTLTNVVVTDELTEDAWTIESLAPGESREFTAEYTVTEADVLAGKVVNVATATGTSPDPEKPDPEVDPGEKEDPTEEKNGHLTITKDTTSTPANGEAYALGETITYRIIAANDGNLTLTDVEVVDELTGDVWTIESLAPGESREFTAEYTVTEADVLAGSVVNVATANGTSPDPEKPQPEIDPGEKEDPTEEKNGHLTLDKVATSTPANGVAYSAGETVTYRITAANDGNLTLTNVEVTDELTDDVWTIESLAPGESREFTAAYVVTEADVLAGSVVNVATANGESPDPENPEPGVDPDEEEVPTNRDYTVTIHYIDNEGNTVAPDYTGVFAYQAPFSVTSPSIDGYTPSAAVVNGTMPAGNIEYVVIYTANAVPPIVPPVPVPTPEPTPNPEVIVNEPEVPATETPETEETDDNADYDLSVVDDEEVPLADMNDDHKCCILHFLILCLGMLIEIWYTHDQKKRQKKIFELREMLAEQTNGEIR